MDRTIVVGGLYRHFKGFKAHVLNLARHSETGEMLVVYECTGKGDCNHTDGIYARPIEEDIKAVEKDIAAWKQFTGYFRDKMFPALR